MYYWLFLGSLILFLGCQQAADEDYLRTVNTEQPDAFPYLLQEPDWEVKLPNVLKEISGLTIYKDSFLIAVQDELGSLFFLDLHKGKIKEQIPFSADGDYEGVEIVDESLFVLRADGVLFLVNDWQNEKINTTVLQTNLSEKNNVEGLGYDFVKNDLLLACKNSSKIGKNYEKSRAIYKLKLDPMQFVDKPAFVFKQDDIKDFLKEAPNNENYKKVKKLLKKGKNIPFQPSAIAVHPMTGNIYFLAAIGNVLIVTHRKKGIQHIQYLPPDEFEQPEGIAFLSNGDLFIASEGKKRKARIYRFNWKP